MLPRGLAALRVTIATFAVLPSVNCFCAKKKGTTIGRVKTMDAANSPTSQPGQAARQNGAHETVHGKPQDQ